jgi:hypothetical protein
MGKNVKNLQIALSAMIIVAFLLMPFNVNGQGGKANFAGTWALNAEKSNFGQPPQGQGQPPQGQGQRMGGGMGQNFTVTQEANKLTVERTRQGQDGQTQKITSVYSLDGKESVNTTGRGESKSTANWAADGKSLTIVTNSTFDMNGETRTIKSTQVWTLTGASTLSIKNTSPSRDGGERTITMVYDKK